jgi:hypothetical protein
MGEIGPKKSIPIGSGPMKFKKIMTYNKMKRKNKNLFQI